MLPCPRTHTALACTLKQLCLTWTHPLFFAFYTSFGFDHFPRDERHPFATSFSCSSRCLLNIIVICRNSFVRGKPYLFLCTATYEIFQHFMVYRYRYHHILSIKHQKTKPSKKTFVLKVILARWALSRF